MLPVVGATPATGRRLRAVVGAAAPPAPTPGGAAGAFAQPRAPQAGEVFFSSNGSPLGAFVEDAADAAIPSTPLGPILGPMGPLGAPGAEACVLAGAAACVSDMDVESTVGPQLALMQPERLAGLQSLISRMLGRAAK
jgi:hypothetical protein